jgi:hypothetical protein
VLDPSCLVERATEGSAVFDGPEARRKHGLLPALFLPTALTSPVKTPSIQEEIRRCGVKILTNTGAYVEFYVVPLAGASLPVVLIEPPSVRAEGPAARDGWRAFTSYALRSTRGEVPPIGDPEAYAPQDLTREERRRWCLGWSIHQAALVDQVVAAAYGSR